VSTSFSEPGPGLGTVCVYGLWHLGAVTAACVAAAGRTVVGLDPDAACIDGLAQGRPPISEPGLAELVQEGLAAGTLTFTTDPAAALAEAEILWVTFDTPVDDDDQADVAWVRAQLEAVRPHLRPGTLVLLSSQVPVGFTASLEQDWRQTDPSLQFACSPENLRLGQAISVFRQPERVVLGVGEGVERERLERLFGPFSDSLLWMSLQSAEMTKHALNGFLALSVAYANELARICERVGADASEVERGLKSEPRIGRRAYLAPGPPMAGGTLLRDIGFLTELASQQGVASPLIAAVRTSNQQHQSWAADRALALLAGQEAPRVALLGLTYKPGTDTLRRSAAVELAQALAKQGISVAAYDPAVKHLPATLGGIELAETIDGALTGADVAILATAWPEFRAISADQLVGQMRQPRVLDQAGFLPHLAADPRLTYLRVGQPTTTPSAPSPTSGRGGV
jgi:UDPglucose 6-dehydrogenase